MSAEDFIESYLIFFSLIYDFRIPSAITSLCTTCSSVRRRQMARFLSGLSGLTPTDASLLIRCTGWACRSVALTHSASICDHTEASSKKNEEKVFCVIFSFVVIHGVGSLFWHSLNLQACYLKRSVWTMFPYIVNVLIVSVCNLTVLIFILFSHLLTWHFFP